MTEPKKNKRHDYSTMLIWAAALVTVVRYASAFIASDMGQITGWVSEAVTIAMGITGLGMGLLDTLGGAYLFDGWRRVMPRSGQGWPFRFKVLTGFIALLLTTGICILVPFTVSRVSHETMEQVLSTPTLLWGWSLMVNLAPYLLIGGVATGTNGLVSVNLPERPQTVSGNLPANYPVERSLKLATNWQRVPGSEYQFIANASTEAICGRFGVTDRTARNWRTWARKDLMLPVNKGE